MNLSLRTSVVCACLALALTSCGGTPDRNTSGGGGEDSLQTSIDLASDIDQDAHFGWAYTQFVSNWDPTKSIGGGDLSFYYPVYDRLLHINQEAIIEPMLVEEFTPAEDGTSVTLKLREGLMFSDGTPLDAEAVKFNLERGAAEGSAIRAEVSQLQSVEVIDPLTVRVTVSSALGAYVTALTARGGMMVSPAAVESGAIANGPVGVGPYVATEILPGDRVELERTPDYWDPDAQNVATMTYYFMADDQTRLNGLQTGEIDGALINPNQINAASRADLQVVSQTSTSFVYFMVNPTQEPFDNPTVRLALNYAVDRQAIADGLYDGHCTASVQPWPEASPAYSEEIGDGLDEWPYDPEKAKELLAEAGYPDGFEFTAITSNVTQYVQLAEAIQQQLAAAGITMEVQAAPAPEILQEFVLNQSIAGNVNPYTGLWDPHGVMARNFLAGGTYGFGGQLSPETTALAQEAAAPIDPEERRPLYQEVMQDMIDNPTHMLSLCLVHLTSAFAPDVSNVQSPFGGTPTLRGVAISKE